MKTWVLQDKSDPSKYAVVKASKMPKDAICPAPAGATNSDGPHISLVTGEVDGIEKTTAVLDQAAKDAAQAALDATKAAIQYKDDRKKAYPSIGDQLDALYKKLALNDSTDYDAIAAQIAQVKLDYPKPE